MDEKRNIRRADNRMQICEQTRGVCSYLRAGGHVCVWQVLMAIREREKKRHAHGEGERQRQRARNGFQIAWSLAVAHVIIICVRFGAR